MKINAKKPSIYFAGLILPLLCSFILCDTSKAAVGSEYPVPNNKAQVSSDANISYNEALKLGKPIVVEFYADWCSCCQSFAPILNDIRKQYEYKYTFVKVNGEKPENAQLMKEFNITSYPSLFLVNPANNQKIMLNRDPYELKRELDK